VRPYFWNRRVISPLYRLRYRLFGPTARIGYMCAIDFDHELGAAMGGSRIWPDVEDLKRNHPCADECGIVEVKIVRTKIVQPSNY
jgi:hypothetical protein